MLFAPPYTISKALASPAVVDAGDDTQPALEPTPSAEALQKLTIATPS